MSPDVLRTLREVRGLTLTQAAALLASEHGGQAETWRVQLTRYERGQATPASGRLTLIMSTYEAHDVADAVGDVMTALGGSRGVARLGQYHGREVVAMALEKVAKEVREL
jgi:transcriptional regulator with XRE-family HTH domain